MQSPADTSNPMLPPQSGQPALPPVWRWIGERGLQVTTDGDTLQRYELLNSLELPEIEDMIPADGSLLLVLCRGAAVSDALRAALAAPLAATRASTGTLHLITIEYGGAAGPDLAALAERAAMDTAAYIDCHAKVEFTVEFLGFQPGFPYLGGLPQTLHTPRRTTPRVRVPAGSVAVGGTYCGIYPAAGPGGWHIIGRTEVELFDPQREAPALLQPGDRVRFVPR